MGSEKREAYRFISSQTHQLAPNCIFSDTSQLIFTTCAGHQSPDLYPL